MIEQLPDSNLKKDLEERLLYQDMLLLKVNNQYEKELKEKEFMLKNTYIEDKSDYSKALAKFFKNIDTLDIRRKRIFIDLVLDKAIINEDDHGYSIKLVISPSKVIR